MHISAWISLILCDCLADSRMAVYILILFYFLLFKSGSPFSFLPCDRFLYMWVTNPSFSNSFIYLWLVVSMMIISFFYYIISCWYECWFFDSLDCLQVTTFLFFSENVIYLWMVFSLSVMSFIYKWLPLFWSFLLFTRCSIFK